jgi:predicted MPP superfamily phosphohydrolase
LGLSRRQFLAAAAFGGVGVVGLGAGDIYTQTCDLSLSRININLPRLPPRLEGFRIAQLSDFHYDRYLDWHIIADAVQATNALQPDAVVLTGDFVTQGFFAGHHDLRSAHYAEPCAQILSGLRSRFGAFAVLGNHDWYTDPGIVTEALRAHGIQVLRNQAAPLEHDGARLWLAGVDDVLGGGDNLDQALRRVPSSEPVVLLAHEPDYADSVPGDRVDLQLSGHSHGGQIVLPLIGRPYLPPLARKYVAGWRRIGKLQLYTNRGVGTIMLPARFNCPPEITLFTLRPGA